MNAPKNEFWDISQKYKFFKVFFFVKKTWFENSDPQIRDFLGVLCEIWGQNGSKMGVGRIAVTYSFAIRSIFFSCISGVLYGPYGPWIRANYNINVYGEIWPASWSNSAKIDHFPLLKGKSYVRGRFWGYHRIGPQRPPNDLWTSGGQFSTI